MLERRRRGAFRASAWLVRCALGCPPAIPAVPGVRTVPGAASHALQHLTHYTVHLRPGDPGHLFPPFLLQAQQECPAQQAQSDMVMPARFRDCFRAWVNSIQQLTQGQVIAVDGKTLRRSHDRTAGKEAIHMVSAWASENSLVLGQTRTDAKSNEITAIPELLKLLDVSGCIVSDAMGSEGDRADDSRGADYLLAVKGNQGRLYDDVRDLFGLEFGFNAPPGLPRPAHVSQRVQAWNRMPRGS